MVSPAKKALIMVAAVLLLLAISYLFIVGTQTGSKMRIALALVIALGPAFFLIALKRPLVFPVSIYALLVPFDNLTNLSRFGTVTKMLGVLAGAAILFWLVKNKKINPPPQSLKMWGILVLWMLFSVFWAIDPTLAWDRVQILAQLLVLYTVLCLYTPNLEDVRILLGAVVVGGLIAAVYGSWVFYHTPVTTMQRLFLGLGQEEIDPNHFAGALLLPMAIVTAGFLRTKKILFKGFFLLATLVLLVGVYESSSRGGIVAVAIIFAYMLLYARQRLQLAMLVLIGLSSSFLMPNSIWARFAKAVSSGGAGRTDIWRVGLEYFKHHWLLGAGVGNFPLAYDWAYLRVFTHYPLWDRGSHNLLISSSAELGVIGLVIMLCAWWTQYAMLRHIPPSSRLYDLRLIAQSAVLGLFTAALFLDVMYVKYTWLIFTLGALVYSLWKIEERDRNTVLAYHQGVGYVGVNVQPPERKPAPILGQ